MNRELRYEADNEDNGLIAQVYTYDDPETPWMVQFIDTDDDAEVQSRWRFFKHYDDAEAEADAFCFGG